MNFNTIYNAKDYAASRYQRKRTGNKGKNLDGKYNTLVDLIQHSRLRGQNVDHEVKELEETKKLLRRSRKSKKIASAQSSTESTSYGCLLLDALKSTIDYLKSVRETIGENVLAFCIDLFTTLYNVYNNCTWDSLVINCTSFFSRHFPTGYVNYAVTWLKAVFDIAMTQSDGKEEMTWKDMILQIFTCSHEFICDELWTNISQFIVKITSLYTSIQTAISFETLDLESIFKGFVTFRDSLPDAKDVVENVFLAFEYIAGNWKNIIKGDFSTILLGKDESKAFEVEVRLLEQAYACLILGKEELCLREYKMNPKQFEQRLVRAIKQSKSMSGRATSAQQKMSLSNFNKSLYEKLTFWEMSKANQTRTAQAYGLKLSGPSGTGKSTLMGICSKVILDAYGYTETEGLCVSANFSEKYESTVMPRHKVIQGDDVANNAKEIPNYDRVLNYVNTIRRPLEKAEVKEKGVMYPNNDALVLTTNDETLKAIKASACPDSILRRFLLDAEVNIREEFRNQYGGLTPQTHTRYDVYELTLKRFSHIEKPVDEEGNELSGPPIIVWDVIPRREWNPFDDNEHDFAAFCRFLSKDVKRHINAQKATLKELIDLDNASICKKCSCPTPLCICKELFEVSDDAHSVSTFSDDGNSIGSDTFCPLPDNTLEGVEGALAEFTDDKSCEAQAGNFFSTFSTRELWDVRSALAGCTDSIRRLYTNAMFWNKIYRNKNFIVFLFAMTAISPILSFAFSRKLGFYLTVTSLSLLIGCMMQWRIQVDMELDQRLDRLSCLCDDVRTHLQNNMVKYFAVGSSILLLYRTYRMIKPFVKVQDKTSYMKEKETIFKNLLQTPKNEKFTVKTQDERDYKEGYSRLPPEISNVAKCSTSEGLSRSLIKHLRRVIVKSQGQCFSTVNGLMVASNVILLPSHAIPMTDVFDIETSTQPDTVSPGTKDQKLTKNSVFLNKERDFALVHLPSAPAGVSFINFFAKEFPTFYSRKTDLLFKQPDGKVIRSTQCSRPISEDANYTGVGEVKGLLFGTRNVRTDYCIKAGQGLVQDLEFNTFGGLCGAPYIDSSKAIIYGFHVAGYPNSTRGYATFILQKDIENGLEQLRETSSSLIVHSAGEVRVNAYDTNHTVVAAPPLCLREDGLGKDAKVTYMGQVHRDGKPMESRARTPYIPTPFKGVKESLGASKHMPPTKPNDVSKAMPTLNKLTNPVQHYEHDILEKAIADYRNQTLNCIRKNKDECKDLLRMYSQQEAMDGIGEFGVEPLKSGTSAGFPINKSKNKVLQRDPMDETAPKVPREFTEDFDVQGEIDRTLLQWRTKTRSETIFKASSKVNELLPTKKALKKVRKFYGGEMSNLIASKMALAGIPRFMRRFWQDTECLVGINPTSKEWKELNDFVTKFGDKMMIAGDFAGFDTRMAAQITGAAAKIMVDWYKEAGCTEEQLELVRGALSEIIHPNIIFEGDLYRFANGNPSGNLITVQLNSICNSIMMRYIYYSLFPNIRQKFSENVALATYGDDNAMGVRKGCEWFNHTACQKEFEKLDIEYTMADKEAKSVPYITIDELSFLKRGFVHHETLDTVVAPIEEDSILKKFHWVKKPTESPLSFAEQFGAYTDGSFREVYLYGRSVYNDFVYKIKEIVDKNPDLKHQVCFISYDEMTTILRPYYLDSYVNHNTKLFAESSGECDPTDYVFERTNFPEFVREQDIEPEDSEEEFFENPENLTEQQMADRIVQVTKKKATGVSGTVVKTIIFFIFISLALPVIQMEVFKWWEKERKTGTFTKQLYERIVLNRDYFFKGVDEAYALDGVAGVAKHLHIPLFIVKLILSEEKH